MEFDNVDTPERENRIECNGCLEPKKAGELSWVKTEGHNRYAVSILSILFITSSLQSCSHTWLTSQELFRNALGIHRVPYGSIGKHNGQRWTPGVKEGKIPDPRAFILFYWSCPRAAVSCELGWVRSPQSHIHLRSRPSIEGCLYLFSRDHFLFSLSFSY